jgi:hypothetical protein
VTRRCVDLDMTMNSTRTTSTRLLSLRRTLLTLVLVGGSLGAPKIGHATPLLWAAVQAAPYEWAGGCTLCHTDNIGSKGTANRPFAKTIKKHGISASSSTADMTKVLEELGDEDSDDDGVSDLEELLKHTDPNVAGATKAVRAVEYRYGCVPAAIGSDSAPNWLWGLALLGVLCLARHR